MSKPKLFNSGRTQFVVLAVMALVICTAVAVMFGAFRGLGHTSQRRSDRSLCPPKRAANTSPGAMVRTTVMYRGQLVRALDARPNFRGQSHAQQMATFQYLERRTLPQTLLATIAPDNRLTPLRPGGPKNPMLVVIVPDLSLRKHMKPRRHHVITEWTCVIRPATA